MCFSIPKGGFFQAIYDTQLLFSGTSGVGDVLEVSDYDKRVQLLEENQ
jgi:hypothetical protein